MSLFLEIAAKQTSFISQLNDKDLVELSSTCKKYLAQKQEKKDLEKMINDQAKYVISSAKKSFDSYKTEVIGQAHHSMWWILDKFFDYFNKEYKLDVYLNKEGVYDRFDTEEDIVKFYFECGGITKLVDSSIQKMKDEFKSLVGKNLYVKINKDKISIQYFFTIDSWKYQWDKVYKFETNSKKEFELLSRVLSYFETLQFNNIKEYISSKFDYVGYNVHVETDEVMFEDCKRVKSIKLFKNRKIELKFHNKHLALEFFQMFELDQIK